MKYQTINPPSSEKRKSRIQKELKELSLRVENVTSHSHQLLGDLRSFVDKKKAEKISNEMKGQSNNG